MSPTVIKILQNILLLEKETVMRKNVFRVVIVFAAVFTLSTLSTLFIVLDNSSRIKNITQEITGNERAAETNGQALLQIEELMRKKKMIP